MDRTERDMVFRTALNAYRAGREEEAWRKLSRLFVQGTTDPVHLSYYGLLLATRKRQVEEGTELCERAVLVAPSNPEMRLNLCRVYNRTGRRSKALTVLRRALRVHPLHPGLRAAIHRIGEREQPTFGSLHRDHLLNRVMGKFRSRLGRS